MWRIIRTARTFPERKYVFGKILSNGKIIGKRFFLSDNFHCREAWEKRLELPILQNLKLGELYNDLDQKFNRDGKASSIDIDLFANAVREESYVDELEDLVHRLRLSANAVYMLPSTPHAVIRTMLEFEKHENLLRILNDRLNYGVFPDDYCSCLLMDTYIKQKKFAEAARIAVLQMLQEDWSHPLTAHLALYSCHMFLANKSTWEEESPPVDDTEEEVKVRVKYLRNPYFDDHFDLRSPELLVGKTLSMLGSTLPDAIGRTYELIGWCLYKKWEKALSLLQQFLKSEAKPVMYKEGIKMLEDILADDKNEVPDDSSSEYKANILSLLEELKTSGLTCDDDLHTTVVNKVKQVVESEEKNLLQQQILVYRDWEVNRENVLQEELKKFDSQKRLARVQEEKEKLVRKEEELFFFDNEVKWDLLIEKKTASMPTEQSEGRKKKQVTVDDNYVPPEI